MSFFDQTLNVTTVDIARRDWLRTRYCEARVLHVGCADWPIQDLSINLHAQLKGHVKQLDGLDTNAEGLAWIKEHVPGDYFSAMSEVVKLGRQYEVVLAPEVIEHDPNPAQFLQNLWWSNPREILVTAPNALVGGPHFLHDPATGYYRETVHPDHLAWYSPYTLLNAVRRQSPGCTFEVYLLEGGKQVAVAARRL